MKKIIAFLLLIITITALCACKKETDYSPFISQYRSDVLYGENDNYVIYALSETREKNYVHDGVCGETEKVVILKLTAKTPKNGKITATFTTDKEYSAEFEFIPSENAFVCKVRVETLPSSLLTSTVTSGENSENVELYSKLKSDTVSPKKAIKAVCDKYPELISSLNNEYGFNAEINVRLIAENDANFWYVGFIDKDNAHAYLVDGKTCKIIAEKTIANDK